MKKRMRTRKSLNVKKRVVGFFAIAVILLGVIGGFGLTHVIAESNSTTGGGADRSAPVAVVASKSDDTSGLLGGGGTNANVVLNSDNTGDSTGFETFVLSYASVPAGKTATLTANIVIPKKSFNGYIMGGFNVSPYKEKAKGTVSSNGTLLKNKFSYSIPIQIHQNGKENQEPKYSVMSVRPNTVSSAKGPNAGVTAKVHNANNAYAGQLSSKAVVTSKSDKKFKITEVKNNQNLAPTSTYNYSISWGKKRLQAGNYHLKLTYKTAGGIKSWVINKDFTITNNDAAKYNKLAGIKPNYLWLWILLGVLALAIILGLGVYLGKRNNNKDNNNNSGNTTRRRRR